MHHNVIETYTIKLKEKSYSTDQTLELMGHRSHIQAVALSEDGELLLSISSGKSS
jgi:hypothetical protein